MLNRSTLDVNTVSYDYWKVWQGYYGDGDLLAKYDTYVEALIAVEMRLNEWPDHTGPVEVNGRLRWYVENNTHTYYEIEGCYNA